MVESLKYFEVHNFQDKEFPVSGSTYINLYQSDRHGQLLEQKKKLTHPFNIARSDHMSE
jgi:hypothetical protein